MRPDYRGRPLYAHEKLFLIVHDLATSQEPWLPRRLANALTDMVVISPDDLPTDELRARFVELREQTTRVPAEADEGTILATARQMHEDEATRHIGTIVSLLSDLARELGDQE